MSALAAVNPVTPAVGLAVNVSVSVPEYNTPAIVTLFPLVGMIPVTVPLKLPLPDPLLNVTVVALVGLAGFPAASCACTVTLNAVPAVPVDGTVV